MNRNNNNHNNQSSFSNLSADFEYRDTINDKLSNMFLALPAQQKAVHNLDMGFINNNPQFQYQSNMQQQNNDFISNNPNITRKDTREGMNNKMFERFETPSTFNNKPLQANQFFNPHLSSYQNSYENQYKLSESVNFGNKDTFYNTPNPNQHQNQYQHQNYYQNQNEFSNYTSSHKPNRLSGTMASTNFILDTSVHQMHPENNNNNSFLPAVNFLPNTNESDRMNYKEMHNERLQSLMPLARTCAIPTPNANYTKSIEQHISSCNINVNQDKNTKHRFPGYNNMGSNMGMGNDNSNNNNMFQNNWYLSNNINSIGPPPKAIVKENRPYNTRNDI